MYWTKKILIVLLFLNIYEGITAQKASREDIKALKVAFITEQLLLTSTEAQNFWPIYNEHEKTIRQLNRKEHTAIRALKETNITDSLSNTDAEKFINEYLDSEKQRVEAEKTMILKLKNVIPYQKIIQLIKAERDFKRKLLNQLRDRRRNN